MIVPADTGATDFEPPVGSGPDQSLSLGLAEAVHDVAFVLDQVSVTDCPKVTVLGDAEIVTVGEAGGAAALPPQPWSKHAPHKTISELKIFFIMPPHLHLNG